MNAIAEYVIAIADLVEAEGRALRQGAVLVGWALALIVLATALLLFGVGLWIWALYLLAETVLPAWLAAALTGAIILGTAGVIAWMSARIVR